MEERAVTIRKWNKAPYGYKLDPQRQGCIIPDEESAEIVKQIFHSAAEGSIFSSIADTMNNLGIPPPSLYRYLHSASKKGLTSEAPKSEWNHVSVQRIVMNPVYTGRGCAMPHTRAEAEKAKTALIVHEPIITEEEYENAFSWTEKRADKQSKSDLHSHHIFTEIACCASCGAPLILNESSGIGVLECKRKNGRGRGRCKSAATIQYDELCDLITDELNEIIQQCRSIEDHSFSNKSSTERRQERGRFIETRIDLIDRIVMRIYEDMESELLLHRSGQSMIFKYQQEISSLLEELEIIKGSINEDQTETDTMMQSEEAESLPTIEELTPTILTAFVERISVGPQVASLVQTSDSSSKYPYDQSIEICYKFNA